MITENLSTLKIHKLTQEQYNREREAGTLDETALYLTPDEDSDLSAFLKIEDAESTYETQDNALTKLQEAKDYVDEAIANSGSGITISPDEPTEGDVWIDTDDNMNEELEVVLSFNGRYGEIIPQSGDYTAEMVGADAEGSAASVLEDAKAYTDEKVSNINNKLGSSTAQVGDLMSSTRTDLGDTWILCNGDILNKYEYSELYELVGSQQRDWYATDLWTGNAASKISCITYTNGYWVVGGTQSGSAVIAYTTDLSKEWTVVSLWTYTTGCVVSSITYADGYWVVSGTYSTGSNTYARIAYATDITGTWTTKDLWNNLGELHCITYADGYWVAGGYYRANSISYARIAYATDPTGTWTTKDLWNSSGSVGCYVKCITYTNGYWVVGGQYYDGSSMHYGRIAYATDITGTWTTKDLWAGINKNTYTYVNCITYADGYWVAGGSIDNVATGRLAYTTDIANVWTVNDWALTINSVTYANGHWILGGKYGAGIHLAYTTNPSEEWETVTLDNATDCQGVNCIVVTDTHWTLGTMRSADSTYYGCVLWFPLDIFFLPTITQDNAYVYIKAKEE